MVVGKITSFENLVVWQESLALAVSVYRTTNSLPKSEIYGLTSQLRRAASSVSANIAEGFGRETNKDKLHFYTIAYGSLLEVKNFLYLSEQLEYITKKDLDVLFTQITSCQKLINASKRSLKS